KANTWYHLAAVRQGNNAFIYLDGAQIGASTNVIGTPFTSADPLTLGYAGHHTAHQGLLARARVYNRALAPEEIKAVREQDRLAQPAFRKSHPIDFNLYDDHNQFVLYIDDEPAGHRLHLELHNTSAKDLQLTKTSDTASATNHHFELRFRPGTLSNKTLETLKDVANKTRVLGATTDWDFFMPNTDSGEPVSLYLLYKGSDTLFKSNEKRRVTFAHISASATGGSRGTQVEMRPHQITFVNATTPITGSRVQTLHITNQRGLKNLPLHVAFIGSNRILNDAGVSTSELKLQLMNVMREHAEHINNPKISLRVADQSKNISASQLIVTFDVEDTLNRPWALCRATELNDFKISVELVKQVKEKRGQQEVWSEQREGNVFTSEPSAGALGESRQWTLTPKKSIDLNPGDYLLLTLAGLKSSLPSGMANLYIHYENIPGYWEGQFTCQVEKAPLLFQQVAGIGTSVGIGASAPQAKLHVINQNQEANHGNTLILGPTTQSNLRLGYHQDYSWVQSHGGKPLAINPLGNNVGVGITNPQRRLHVMGQGQTVMRLQTIGSTNPLSQTWDILIDVDDVNDQDLMFLFNDGRNTGNWASAWVEPNGGVRSNSDARLKEDIKPLQNVLPKVLALQPSTFRWKGRVTEHRDIGLIAQEVEKVFPHLVREKHGGYALNYDHFAVLAIAAIQEQQRVIEKLEKEISQFEAKPAAQKSAKAKPTTKKKAAKKKRALSSR
ncbi:tail fiber domain-containing protein, partial [candidate division KSB1 bacterium]|nr:tail fiber domain-containing protein [candidate division KSB1 bacterium]